MFQSKYARGNKSGTQLRGLFENGQWKCDCSPRYPAISFEVKKPGPNHGKLFYTCAQEKRCGFFLWRHDAVVREGRAVLANSRTEPQTASESASKSLNERAQAAVTGAPRSATPTASRHARSKTPELRPSLPPPLPPPGRDARSHLPEDTPSRSSRSFLDTSKGEEETTSFELTSDDEKALVQAEKQTDKSGPVAAAAAAAPSLPVNRVVQFTTPSKRKFADITDPSGSLPTPETHGKRLMTSATRSASVVRTKDGEGLDELLNLVSPQTTPTPARFKDAVGGGDDGDLWGILDDIFRDEHVEMSDTAQQKLRSACMVHARKNKGILQGRNILRKALNARDHKIALLEAELDMEREVIKCLRDKT